MRRGLECGGRKKEQSPKAKALAENQTTEAEDSSGTPANDQRPDQASSPRSTSTRRPPPKAPPPSGGGRGGSNPSPPGRPPKRGTLFRSAGAKRGLFCQGIDAD